MPRWLHYGKGRGRENNGALLQRSFASDSAVRPEGDALPSEALHSQPARCLPATHITGLPLSLRRTDRCILHARLAYHSHA